MGSVREIDVQFRLSGGAGNLDPAASLGGVISAVECPTALLGNLFDDVSTAELTAGDVEYRCFYLRNGHATSNWNAIFLWISEQTTSPDSVIDIGFDPAGAGGTATTIANESTAPSGVTFSHPTSRATALGPFPLTAVNRHIGVWLRRTITAAGSVAPRDDFTLRLEGF